MKNHTISFFNNNFFQHLTSQFSKAYPRVKNCVSLIKSAVLDGDLYLSDTLRENGTINHKTNHTFKESI